MSNQLIKTTELGKENVFPRTRILDLFDNTSGLKLIDILKSFNMMFVPYLGNKSYTRNQISPELRRQGLWLTYVIDNTVYTEWYDEVAIDDTNWGSNSNWRQGSNALVGDLSISPNGTWVINGEDSGITIKGDKGDSPVIRIYDNKILVSYDKGVTYEDLNNTPVYTKFRFNSLTNTYLVSYDLGDTWQDVSTEKVYHKFRYNSTTNTYLESIDFGKTWSNISAEKVYYLFRYNAETNTHLVSTDLGLNWTDVSSNKVYYQFRTNDNRLLVSTDLGTTWENCSEPIAAWFRWADVSDTGNVGKVLISRDNNTWEDLSPTMTNNLYIKGYVVAVGNLPSNAAIGDIYMVGPTYDESDTTLDYPHYRMWIKLSSGWVDNGEYQSNVLISLTTGLETGITMSLKAITNSIEAEIARAKAAEQAIIYDVSSHNDGAVFESISALLGNPNIDTLIPVSFRHGGMTIRFIQGSELSSDNKYVQFRLMSNVWSTTVTNWQGVDNEPTAGSDNLVKSSGIRNYVRNGFLAKDETIISDTSNKIIIEDDNENTIVTIDGNGINVNNLFKNGVEVLDNNDKTELESSINSIATHEIGENSEQAIIIEDDRGVKYSKILLDENPAEEEAIVIEDNDGNEKLKINKLGVYINGVKHKNPSVIIVDPNGNGDYTTIGSAISNTHDGDTILVMEGVYEEHIEMYNKERHLIGVSKESVVVVTHDGLRSNNPCNANVGSIENMTFIAMIDEIPEDYYDRPAINRATYGIHIDVKYTSSARHKITIRNCRCISYAHAGIGIGVRYNQTIEIIDCELITYKSSAGGFLMHNDDFYPDSNGAELIVNNCICKGVDKAVHIGSLNNNALCTISFINTTCYTSENGVTNIITKPTNKKWGTDISLSIISHGNNINDLNY